MDGAFKEDVNSHTGDWKNLHLPHLYSLFTPIFFVEKVNFYKQKTAILLIPPQELPALRSYVPAVPVGALPGTEGCPPSRISQS